MKCGLEVLPADDALDLRIVAQIAPASFTAGDTINIDVTILNDDPIGATTVDLVAVNFWISPDDVFGNADDYSIGGDWAWGGPIGLGQQVTSRIVLYTAPWIAGGTYHLFTKLDYNDLYAEFSETNNITAGQIQVVGLPLADLTVTELVGPPDLTVLARGDSFNLTTTVHNAEGHQPTYRGWISVRHYISPNLLLGDGDADCWIDPLSGRIIYGDLTGGGSNTGTATVSIPSYAEPGTYYLMAVVDELNDIPESDDGNNLIVGTRIVVQ